MQLIFANNDFRRLWLAQTFSQIGSQIAYLAIPLTAAVTLNATPFEMGLLTAAGSLPALMAGLIAGTLVDRRARRPLLISADLVRACLLAIVPLAWFAGVLTMPMLFVVALLSGLCALFYDLAYQAFLPSIIDRKRLVEGNSALELSRSAAELVAPALAGGLIQVLKAPVTLILDAASFLVSALLIARIKIAERVAPDNGQTTSLRADASEGIRQIQRTSTIRTLAGSVIGFELFNAMTEAVVIIYLTREIGMEPLILGIVFAAGGLGFVIGAMLPSSVGRRVGIGPSLAAALIVIGLSDLAIPLVGHDLLVVGATVAISQFLFGLGMTVFNVTRRSLVQVVVPNGLIGRIGGAFSMFGAGMAAVGAILGGMLGSIIGLQQTLVLAAMLEMSLALWIWHSPLWSLRAVELAAET